MCRKIAECAGSCISNIFHYNRIVLCSMCVCVFLCAPQAKCFVVLCTSFIAVPFLTLFRKVAVSSNATATKKFQRKHRLFDVFLLFRSFASCWCRCRCLVLSSLLQPMPPPPPPTPPSLSLFVSRNFPSHTDHLLMLLYRICVWWWISCLNATHIYVFNELFFEFFPPFWRNDHNHSPSGILCSDTSLSHALQQN